ncbi:MAG: MBL fold metallo-hydrolase [Parvibaculum sp.]|nr:MBL fold metallo-hydrolase [Parvibaculum sp.]MBO6693337.1 MBL fold metallo-hydrolase [Parvibaculum sp.]MBO6714751.1 MBL fold metallo-hydrolase [Parvibaculum sp.]
MAAALDFLFPHPTPSWSPPLKIAERWFERKEVGDGVTLLYEPHVHPFIRCNIWFVRGRDRDLLIDTGTGVASLKDAIADLTDKPLTAVATHIHYDHVGSLHEFDTRLMHEIEAPRMEDYREFAALTSAGFPAVLRESLAGYGLDGEDAVLVDALPHDGFSLDSYRITSTHATGHLKEGDVVDLGDRHFSVFHLPGHSPGSLGLFEDASKTLFSGDAIYDGPLLDELPDSDIAAYLTTIKRLRGLDVRVVHGGHDPSFGRERLIQICDDYLALRG